MKTIKEVLNGRLPCSNLEQELIAECDNRDIKIRELEAASLFKSERIALLVKENSELQCRIEELEAELLTERAFRKEWENRALARQARLDAVNHLVDGPFKMINANDMKVILGEDE